MLLHRVTARRALPALALALASLAYSTAAAADDDTELVTWGSGGKEAGLGIAGEGHIGFGYRFDDSPLGEPQERAGFLFGGTALVRPFRWAAFGLGYEHLDLGQDRADLPPDRFREVERDLNTFWGVARVYPVRADAVSIYLGLGLGASWQSLDMSVASLDSFNTADIKTTTCAGNDSAALGLRAGLGVEVPLKLGLVLMGEAGVDRYQLSGDTLDGCAAGAGKSTLFALRAGFAYGLEVTKKPPKPIPPQPPPPDRDRDGIVDAYDACPDVPGIASNDPAKHGCPPPKDTDGDSFIDELDACPTVPGVANKDPLKNGCPPKDTDNDGVIDDEDACVEIPGQKTTDPATNGCPGDTDADSFRDDKDGCPTEKGVANPDPAKNGCPVVQLTKAEIVINEQVQFDTDKATIKEVSFPLLDTVAKIIKDHPEFLKIEVQGHTDNVGPPKHNKTLSQNRADSVRKALIKRGIAWDRFESKGYGQDVPVADNAAEEGRAKNRRVQFKILKTKGEVDAAAEKKPADAKPAGAVEKKPAEAKPAGAVEKKPADAKPAGAVEKKPADAKPVGAKPDGKQ